MINSYWYLAALAILFVVVVDNFIFPVKNKTDSLVRVSIYLTISAIFAAMVFLFKGKAAGIAFTTCFLLEYSLSIDNIFIFFSIINAFNIKKHTCTVLSYGIGFTIFFRTLFIAIGAYIMSNFSWALIIFGVLLIYSGIKMIKNIGLDPDAKNSILAKLVGKVINLDLSIESNKPIFRRDGKIFGTRLLLGIILAIAADIVCAVDSIPAAFSITNDSFTIYASNLLAILGLRSMYNLIIPIIEKLKSMEYGLCAILIFIGTKICLNHFIPGFIGAKFALIFVAGVVLICSFISLFLNLEEKKR